LASRFAPQSIEHGSEPLELLIGGVSRDRDRYRIVDPIDFRPVRKSHKDTF